MDSFRDKLVATAAKLGYGSDSFRPLDDGAVALLVQGVERAFGDLLNGVMAGWWRDSNIKCLLPTASDCFHESDAWRHLISIAPDPAAPVWLITENWSRGQTPFFAFESTASVVSAVIGNTHGFEYVVCGKRFDWLFAENHHNWVSVAGAEASRACIRKLKDGCRFAQPPTQLDTRCYNSSGGWT